MIPVLLAAARLAAPMIGRAVGAQVVKAGASEAVGSMAGRAASGGVNLGASMIENRRQSMEQGQNDAS